MIIKRIEVDGGFLNGLDLQFNSALSAIIGPRGSGKTSVIELIRYCLDVAPIVPRSPGVATRQALSVLDDGKVSVTLADNGEEFTVSRTAGYKSSSAHSFPEPVILAATEIERIGVEPGSRLALIDAFLISDKSDADEQRILAELSAAANQVQTVLADIEELRAEHEAHPELDKQLKQARVEQAKLQQDSPALDAERKRLEELGNRNKQLAAERAEADRLQSAILKRAEALRSIADVPSDLVKSKRLTRATDHVRAAQMAVQKAITELDQAQAAIDGERVSIDAELLPILEATRPVRAKLNEHVAGLGTITAKIQSLEQLVNQRSVAKSRIASASIEMERLRNLRESLLIQLEAIRNKRFLARERAAAKLTKRLGPRIRVTVSRAGALNIYEAQLAEILRGSGLHKSLFGRLAKAITPRDLISFVERSDVAGLRNLAGIAAERARRIVDHLRARDYSPLLTLNVEDEVKFWLLDGVDYKSSEEVSTGQRCTIVLPILMEQLNVPLILDQPEDHLDNAFIVETLVWALQQRKRTDQVIIATHNPNIPVLGEAEEIVLLGSDGRSGYVRHHGELNSPAIVEAITTVMEGGREAFERRATFYREYGAIVADA